MRLAILGNSGSGKSTLARWAARQTRAAMLDLDTIVWEPGLVAVARPHDAASADLHAFCAKASDWIVEGCYASLIGETLQYAPLLIFLNPGKAQCIANCRNRSWEPHKYSSKEEQDKHLDFLLTWVDEYYTRDGDMALAAHQACFGSYPGRKIEVPELPVLTSPSPEVRAWLS